MRLTVKSDFLFLEVIKVEERRRGLGRSSSAPSELVCLHIVVVNSHLATFFYKQEEHLGEYPGAPHIVAVNSHLATFFYKQEEHLGECPGPYSGGRSLA